MTLTSAATPPDDYAPLVRAAAAGDVDAMDQLLRRAQGVARRFSLAVCGDADDAEDALQEALLKTYRSTRQIRDARAFRPWLYRIVRNACLVSRRRRAHEPSHIESLDERPPQSDAHVRIDPADPGRDPEQMAHDARLRARVRDALGALPRSYRAVLFLRDMEGLSTREVASVMRISEDNVKTRLSRARAALKAKMQDDALTEVRSAPTPPATPSSD